MQVKELKGRTLMGLTLSFFVLLIFTGCGNFFYMMSSEESKVATITGVDYDEAFSKALRAVADIGLGMHASDKSSGTFRAFKFGLFETTDINFLLEKDSQGKLTAIIRVKSGKSDAAREFIDAYGKYVKISS
jgi:hypothetical protein